MKHYKIKFEDKEFDASEYQDAIFDCVEHGVGNMIINAAAGAAKTTTIVNCMNIIDKKKKVLFIAFNKDIVETIRKKIGNKPNVKVSTFHSLGFSIFKENTNYSSYDIINEFKYKNYIKSHINELTEYEETNSIGQNNKKTYISNIINLVDYSRYYMKFKTKEIEEMVAKYKIDIIRDEVAVCQKVLKWGQENIDTIDYTDMIWIPNVLNYTTNIYRYDWILIDEAQDITKAEKQLIDKCNKRGTRVVTTGDREQRINIWCGSDESAIDEFKENGNAKEFRLPISYRCPKKIVEKARQYSDNIVAANNAIDGVIKYNVSKNEPKNGDMVLCRITSPLVELHMHYMRINKKSHLMGFETVRDKYLELINNTNSVTIDKELITCDGLMPSLYKVLLDKIRNIKEHFGLDDDDAMMHPDVFGIYDAIQGIRVMSEGISTVPELVDKINTIFHGDSDDAIQLSTVHKAKGLEADNVYILMPSLMPIKYATQDWEKTTEKNLIYVAITRAKKSLNYIEEENKTFGIAPSNIFDFDSMKKMVTLVKNKLHANDNIGIKEIKDNYHITYDERLNKIKNLGEKKETNNINDKKKNKKAAMRMQKFLE